MKKYTLQEIIDNNLDIYLDIIRPRQNEKSALNWFKEYSKNTKVIINKYIPFGNYLAINLFGIIFSKRELKDVELNHELIHTAQMKELFYIPFYILYGIEWVYKVIKYGNFYKGYRNISFEKEAYDNQYNLDYLLK